jgi:hypothetical protein
VKIAKENEELNPDLRQPPPRPATKRLKDWENVPSGRLYTAIAAIPRPNAAPRYVFHVLQLLGDLKKYLNFPDSRAPLTKRDTDLEACANSRNHRPAVKAPGSLKHTRKVLRSWLAKMASERERLIRNYSLRAGLPV